MIFHPKLSKLQSETLFKIKKLMKSEFAENISIHGKKLKGIDLSDSYLKINGKYIFTLTDEYVFDSNNKKFNIEDLLKKDLKPLNEFLEIFILDTSNI